MLAQAVDADLEDLKIDGSQEVLAFEKFDAPPLLTLNTCLDAADDLYGFSLHGEVPLLLNPLRQTRILAIQQTEISGAANTLTKLLAEINSDAAVLLVAPNGHARSRQG